MLHRRKHFHLLFGEDGDHFIICRMVGVEAAQRIEIPSEALRILRRSAIAFKP
jgi:hypothetical protein